MNFGMIILNQSTKTKQNYATRILIALLLTFSLKIFFEDINNDVERWFNTSNYDKNDKRPLQTGINKKVIRMFKDELGGKTMKEFCALRVKTYVYLMDDDSEKEKATETKICMIKREIMFENYTDLLFNNNTIWRSQLRFKSSHHNVYTKEINKIAVSSNDDKRLQTSDGIITYPYGTNAFKVCESEMLMVKNLFFEKLQWNIISKINIKMINFDNYVNENEGKHNKNSPYVPYHPYRILIIGGSGSAKTNLLLNLIENQPEIDKIYLYAEDPYEAKYQYLINKREGVGIEHFNHPKAFIEYSNDMHDVYKNIDEYNHDKEKKILIVFDDMIADTIHNKKLHSVITNCLLEVEN